MIYLERRPAAPLDGWVRMIWYAQAPQIAHARERVLPNGCVQVVINLDRDFIWNCADEGRLGTLPNALVVGARSVYEIVDSADMAAVAGIVFEPGAFACFAREPVDVFSNENVALEDVWGKGARALRDRLLETCQPGAKLGCIEEFLRREFSARLTRHCVVEHALYRFRDMAGVNDVAAETGRSVRYLSQVFRERVGLGPKAWCRVQRFQKAVRELHRGGDVRWAELALDCGYYDQSHFANEFRAFSGIDATTYSAGKTAWVNHVAVG